MEFNEKLCKLRKEKNLTQEELAEALYVSRTAISKWESARGYPSIDSLKQISGYFSVSIDDLLSGEKLASIAEKENRTNIKNICNLLFGIFDLMYFLLIALPLYPKPLNGYVFAVSFFAYNSLAPFNRTVYLSLFTLLIALGAAKIFLSLLKIQKTQRQITAVSEILGILTVLYTALAREAYAVCISFLLFIIKSILLSINTKADKKTDI